MSRRFAVRRCLAAAALVPLVATSLAACGDGGKGSAKDGADDGATAATAASSSPSGPTSPASSEGMEPAAFLDRIQTGLDNTTTAHETLSMAMGSGVSMAGEGDVDYTGDSPSMTMTMSTGTGQGELDVRLIDKVVYMSIPGMTNGKFVKLDLDDPDNPLGPLAAQLDPAQAFHGLEKGIDSVTFVGSESSLVHYRVGVDTATMLGGIGQKLPAGADLPKTMDYDVWLDDQSRINRLEMKMGPLGTMKLSLSDFGKDVTIEAPPESQVTEMPGAPAADG